ncbi:hypothetical protein L5515_018529 [Caenorhabditis briggsae]|uniref:Uncharacterized protein n=1 Tax=Caenorhabditis briggsae TaxID=6238 RepID=A0AAE8ZV14_CAEBR|nr:hypothetical protein L3Y34_012672 [Caenorhabditis briggsae]UMM42859.1 hypothetical protein L5515_018529 [Caenorhabditis briggsae]
MAATSNHLREPERVNLLEDHDDSDYEDEVHVKRNPQMWPSNLTNSSHAEAGLLEASDGILPGCVGQANRMIRIAFLRKVLGIVGFQLLFTIGICVAIYHIPNSKTFLQNQ